MNQMELHTKILGLRKKSGITQQVMAESLNVSRQTISKWETGAVMPDVANLTRIANLFQVSVDYLLNVNSVEEVVDLNIVSDEDIDCEEEQQEKKLQELIEISTEEGFDESSDGMNKKNERKLFFVFGICFLVVIKFSLNSPTIASLYVVFVICISLVIFTITKTIKRKNNERRES